MKKRKNGLMSILFLLVILVGGCGSKHIVLAPGGAPVNPYSYQISIPVRTEDGNVSELKAVFSVSGYYTKKTETDQEVFWPEHFDITKKLEIHSHLECLVIHLRIINPEELNYQIWQEYIAKKDGDKFPITVQQQIVESNQSDKNFEIFCPIKIKNIDVKFNVVVKNSAGEKIFELLPVVYEVWGKSPDFD